MIADLHVHTTHSDGTMTPAELAQRAHERGVGLLAVADHDVISGSEELRAHCVALGIGYVPAVELDCMGPDRFYHVLAYGVDMSDPDFRRNVVANRAVLDGMSELLVQRMMSEYPKLSMADYEAFVRDPRVGGWKGIEYLWRRGVVPSMRAAMRLYDAYGVSYEQAGFPAMQEWIDWIHRAGGRAVLAHPGEMIDSSDMDAFMARLIQLVDLGLDGIECHYPKHTALVQQRCMQLCEERSLMITCGSDCHGTFGNADVGELPVSIDRLQLNGLKIL